MDEGGVPAAVEGEFVEVFFFFSGVEEADGDDEVTACESENGLGEHVGEFDVVLAAHHGEIEHEGEADGVEA